jgi:hypothetical protein
MNLTNQYIINPKIKEVYFKGKSCDYKRSNHSNKRIRLSIVTRSKIHNEFQHITRFKIRNISFNMIKCPLGTLKIATKSFIDPNPIKKIIFNNHILIGETEVTQELFELVMGYNPSHFKDEEKSRQHPVENVTWYEAVIFCNRLSLMFGKMPYYKTDIVGGEFKVTANEKKSNGFRLPHEREWEYAAKAGTSNNWSGTNNQNELDEVAWTPQNANNLTHEVKKKRPNEWKVYDMTGNVWEWCDNDDFPSKGTIKGGAAFDQYQYIGSFTALNIRIEMNKTPSNLGNYQSNLGFRIALSIGYEHLVKIT